MMNTQLRESISAQISEMIGLHIQEMDRYISLQDASQLEAPAVLNRFCRLADICDQPPAYASQEDYLEAQSCLEEIEGFIRAMNQDIDEAFGTTEIGEFVSHCTRWRKSAADQFRFTLDDVWDIIAPVVPDHMEELSQGMYEAQWWFPVPKMDIEILIRSEGVVITEPPFEPAHLPGGLSVRFSVTDVHLPKEVTS